MYVFVSLLLYIYIYIRAYTRLCPPPPNWPETLFCLLRPPYVLGALQRFHRALLNVVGCLLF